MILVLHNIQTRKKKYDSFQVLFKTMLKHVVYCIQQIQRFLYNVQTAGSQKVITYHKILRELYDECWLSKCRDGHMTTMTRCTGPREPD